MTTSRSLVSVVDDDESVRESLPDLLREFGFAARAFASAEEFLASDCVAHTNCLILDIAMPGMGGPALQRELSRRQWPFPSSSSPPTGTTAFVLGCSRPARWTVCSSRSAKRRCWRRSVWLFGATERRTPMVDRGAHA